MYNIANLLVSERLSTKSKYNHFMWKCLCDCGKEKIFNTSDLRKTLKYKTISCGCLRFHQDQNIAILFNEYSRLKRRQRKKSSSPLISFETFKLLSLSNCYYCGSKPSNKSVSQNKDRPFLMYSGIDRINSYLGYEDGNVRSCCKKCNVAKCDMTEDEFIVHLKKIYDHLQLAE